jgi:hypothetical protein
MCSRPWHTTGGKTQEAESGLDQDGGANLECAADDDHRECVRDDVAHENASIR